MADLRRIAVGDASAKQLRKYLTVMDLAPGAEATREEMLESIRLAQLGDFIVVADDAPGIQPAATSLDELFAEPLDLDAERWMRIRFGVDADAQHKDSAVEVVYRNEFCHCTRNVDLCIRERFVRVLNDAKEVRVVQDTTDESQKFSDAKRYTTYRHPFTFLGIPGLVRDGVPKNLPPGCKVIQQR